MKRVTCSCIVVGVILPLVASVVLSQAPPGPSDEWTQEDWGGAAPTPNRPMEMRGPFGPDVVPGQAQFQQRWEQMQSGDFSPPEGMEMPEGMEIPEGFSFGGFSDGGQQSEGQLPSMTVTDFQLRQGMTVTVSIIISEATDVIIVPNGAVSSEGGQYYVEVVSASGETEKRAVQIGISDWQYTEITDGLREGEQVVVPEGTSTSTTQNQFQGPGGNIMFRGGL